MEEKIKKLMESLEITEEEAREIIAFDNEEIELDEVDEMTEKAKEFQKTEVKRGRKPRAKGEGTAGVTQQKRVKKDNPIKQNIITQILNGIENIEGIQNIQCINIEKTIVFEIDGNTYEIDLKQKRKPKN